MVCGHIGYPWTGEMIAVADEHPNVPLGCPARHGSSVVLEGAQQKRERSRGAPLR